MRLAPVAYRFALALVLAAAPAACAMQPAETSSPETTAAAEDDLTQRPGRFETFTGKDGQFYFHLLAGNGEKLVRSEGYASHAGAEAGVKLVQGYGVDASTYELLEAKNGEHYFNIVAGNGQVLATSETYVSKSNAERAIGTVVGVVQRTVDLAAAPTGSARFQLFKGLDKQYYFHLRAGNGEIVLQSEGYKQRASAVNGIASVRSNAANASRFQVLEAQNGQHYFVLRASNGQVIGRGEMYASKYGAEQGVKTVAQTAAGAAAAQ
jgi:uncharacterized protein YegP (UPF0339 family)